LPCYKPDKTDLSQNNLYILSEEEKKNVVSFLTSRSQTRGSICYH